MDGRELPELDHTDGRDDVVFNDPLISKAYTLTCEVTYLRAGLHHYKSFGYKILSEVTSVGASTFIVLLNGNLRTNCPINRDCMAALRRLFQLSG